MYLGEGSHLVRVTLGRQLAVAVSFAMLYAQLAASCSGWERRKQGAAWAAVIDTCLDPPPAGGERGRPHAPLLLATPRRPLLRRIGRDGALHRMMRAALLHSSPVLLAEVAAAALGGDGSRHEAGRSARLAIRPPLAPDRPAHPQVEKALGVTGDALLYCGEQPMQTCQRIPEHYTLCSPC